MLTVAGATTLEKTGEDHQNPEDYQIEVPQDDGQHTERSDSTQRLPPPAQDAD